MEQNTLTEYQKQFCTQLHFVVSKNFDDPDFNVCILARELEISRRQLYREMGKMNLKPSAYLKMFRLSRAKELIEAGTYARVSSLAYSVGYSDPDLFTKHFQVKYLILPSTLLRAA